MLLVVPEGIKRVPGGRRYYEAVDEKSKSLYQVVARGRLECVPDFRVRKADDGDPVAGNGFGGLGLLPCRIEVAIFEAFGELR